VYFLALDARYEPIKWTAQIFVGAHIGLLILIDVRPAFIQLRPHFHGDQICRLYGPHTSLCDVAALGSPRYDVMGLALCIPLWCG